MLLLYKLENLKIIAIKHLNAIVLGFFDQNAFFVTPNMIDESLCLRRKDGVVFSSVYDETGGGELSRIVN